MKTVTRYYLMSTCLGAAGVAITAYGLLLIGKAVTELQK